jgi:predicted transcriptional regulator
MKYPVVVVTKVSEELARQVRRVAEAEDRTVCSFIRTVLREAIARRASEETDERRA